MVEFRMRLERLEEGHVRGTLVECDEISGEELQVWVGEAHLDMTRKAQLEVMHAAMNFLRRFVDLSQGGRA